MEPEEENEYDDPEYEEPETRTEQSEPYYDILDDNDGQE
ncbi:hypothetical protein ACP70R_002538 [Stipagrostis hirtigluma subsp. patula]